MHHSAAIAAPTLTLKERAPELFTQMPEAPHRPKAWRDPALVAELFRETEGLMPSASREWLEGFLDDCERIHKRPDIGRTVAAYALAAFLPENAYRRELYEPSRDDPEQQLKEDSLDGVDDYIAIVAPYRPSPLLFHSLAVRAARRQPLEEVSMAAINDDLPFAWQILDAAIHADGKVTETHLLALSCLYKASGHIPTHACSCSTRSASLVHSGVVEFGVEHVIHEKPGEPAEEKEARIRAKLAYLFQHAWFSHFCVELFALLCGLPTGVRTSRQLKDAAPRGLFERVFTLAQPVSA